jgi:protein-arginine kinase activator protein McsA
MEEAVALLEFEQAAEIRDRIKSIKRKLEMQEGRKHQKATQKNR